MLDRGIFITGTDTGVGKTYIASLFCEKIKTQKKISYYKPVQTGCEIDDDTKTVIDQAQLRDGEWCEPSYRLKAPLSPDRAAEKENVILNLEKLDADFANLQQTWAIVEGAGGLEVPITTDLKMSGLAKRWSLPLVIVASTRLGTINHTLLTWSRAQTMGLSVLGVILNGPEDSGLKEILEREGIKVLCSIPQGDRKVALEVVDKLVESRVFASLKELDAEATVELDDRRFVWHPFTQHGFDSQFSEIVSGEGSYLELASGEKILDAISSWWVNLHGHSHPYIADAVARQANKLEHVIFSGYTHAPAVNLSRRLLDHVKKVQPAWSRVFFSDNGSTSVEVALKMAYQFSQQRGELSRKRFLALSGSYHGDTLAAMSVSEREAFHKVFTPLMAPVDFVAPDDFLSLEKIDWSQYAAVIFEPLAQGAAGMKFYSSAFLQTLCQKAQKAGVLTVADEIFTGFYRTGTFLACEQAGVRPDLLCLSKGITGGFLPLSVTIATEDIFSAFCSQEMAKAFLHGHSYTANPIACSAALASLDLLERSDFSLSLSGLVEATREEIQNITQLPMVQDARFLGTIGAFEVLRPKEPMTSSNSYLSSAHWARQFAKECEKRGALVRPLGETIYTVPPYCTSTEQLKTIYKSIRESLFSLERRTL